jgi:hypothetical protein
MGDTWPSRENLIYIPRPAVVLGAMEDEPIILNETASPFKGSIALANVFGTPHISGNFIGAG